MLKSSKIVPELKSSICILCLLSPITVLGSFSGYCCISVHRHHRTKSPRLIFAISKIRIVLTVLSSLATVYYFFNRTKAAFDLTEFNPNVIISLLNEIVFCFGDSMLKLYFLLKTGEKVKMFVTYQSVANQSASNETYNTRSNTDKSIQAAKFLQYLNICTTLIVLLAYAIVWVLFNDSGVIHSIKLYIDLILLYDVMAMVFQISSESVLVNIMFRKLHKGLVKALLKRRNTLKNTTEGEITPLSLVSKRTSGCVRHCCRQCGVPKDLQRLRFYHIAVMKCFKTLKNHLGVGAVLWCSFASILLMMNSYIIITSCLDYNAANTAVIVSCALKFLVSFSGLWVLLFNIQSVANVVSSMCLLFVLYYL